MSEIDDEDDIILQTQETEFTDLRASGVVNGDTVDLTTKKEHTAKNQTLWYVIASVDGETNRESFRDKDKAEAYFDRLVEKHGLCVDSNR